MKIVFLDAGTIGQTDLSTLSRWGEITIYEQTTADEVTKRSVLADILITNKVRLPEHELSALPNLKLICIAATGMNNVDLSFAAKKGIIVRNVSGYSTESVAQTTFAMFFSLYQKLSYYDQYVKSGEYSRSNQFTHHGKPFSELSGKKWGIIGLGNIGKRVAEIATVFGAEVIYFSTSGKNRNDDYKEVTLDELLGQSDIISIHAPLNDQTLRLISIQELKLMKKNAIIINAGRGGIIDESDLTIALRNGLLAGAALDVYESEPLNPESPLLSDDVSDRLLLLPHIAWASVEARQKLVEGICTNIENFCSQYSD